MLCKAYYHYSKYASSQISWTLFWYLLRREYQKSSGCIHETKVFWWNLEDLVLLSFLMCAARASVPASLWGLC